MRRPDFAVALYHGAPLLLASTKPAGFIMWSSFCLQASHRFSPGELLVAEARLRSGWPWTSLERDLTLVAGFAPASLPVELANVLAAIVESKDATWH